MLVKNHMLTKEKLTIVDLEETIENTLKRMGQESFLSLPVVNNGDLAGIIMKETIYRGYVEEGYDNFQDYITNKKVKDIYTNKVRFIHETDEIEKASHVLGELKIPFLAVLDSNNKFTGILTHRAIFNTFSNMLGINKGSSKLVIDLRDISGELARLTNLIKEENINISNIAMMDSKIEDNVRIVLKLDIDDTKSLTDKIRNSGFIVEN
ncbi:CBS domain-containing protein [Paratissierella segnis]|uniref:CBS domain-containing protein n=1 Tax=Paratissierella segnis TaxID=2763679 RepID=A0A926EVJ2_9FIRM|nr:CBS domain-containing protein [Paratissierella segnis]MBC8588287.1 CBS domain-containing protein [Paratissierella segnis]